MGLRFESNFNTIAGIAPFLPDDDPLSRWIRVHEWSVDDGFTGTLLAVMLNAEPLVPTPATVNYGWMRVRAMLDVSSKNWVTKYESKINGAAMTAKQFTPRLVILPCGSGITLTAGQGLMTQALGGTTASNRWWSCYVIKADAA